MEKEKSYQLIRNQYHEKLMVSILKKLADTPLVLKGGTALYLGYGLNRFSEDLDFDSSRKLNLLSRIKEATPIGFQLENIKLKKDTDTVSRYIINYSVASIGLHDMLKMEISYRTPVPESDITVQNGIRFASLERIIDNKLNAAFDGENTRIKARDLFDLHYLAKKFPQKFTEDLAKRLYDFAKEPDKLFSVYASDIQFDVLLEDMDLETTVLELQDISNKIVSSFTRNKPSLGMSM